MGGAKEFFLKAFAAAALGTAAGAVGYAATKGIVDQFQGACEFLGLSTDGNFTEEALEVAVKTARLALHPDQGLDRTRSYKTYQSQRVDSARDVVRRVKGWSNPHPQPSTRPASAAGS